MKGALKDNFVDSVADVDVENIPFPDQSFDIVICKETFHHWPRPWLGFYECLRVAKKAVLLIEPNDTFQPVDATCYRDLNFRDAFENIGNYKYQVSIREFLKVAWSLYLPSVVHRGINDPFNGESTIEEYKKLQMQLNQMHYNREREANLLAIGILKVDVDFLEDLVNDYVVNTCPPKQSPFLT